jgi:hypothetical protein
VRHNAQQMQRIRLIWKALQDASIDRLRLRQLAGLMVPDRQSHRIL